MAILKPDIVFMFSMLEGSGQLHDQSNSAIESFDYTPGVGDTETPVWVVDDETYNPCIEVNGQDDGVVLFDLPNGSNSRLIGTKFTYVILYKITDPINTDAAFGLCGFTDAGSSAPYKVMSVGIENRASAYGSDVPRLVFQHRHGGGGEFSRRYAKATGAMDAGWHTLICEVDATQVTSNASNPNPYGVTFWLDGIEYGTVEQYGLSKLNIGDGNYFSNRWGLGGLWNAQSNVPAAAQGGDDVPYSYRLGAVGLIDRALTLDERSNTDWRGTFEKFDAAKDSYCYYPFIEGEGNPKDYSPNKNHADNNTTGWQTGGDYSPYIYKPAISATDSVRVPWKNWRDNLLQSQFSLVLAYSATWMGNTGYRLLGLDAWGAYRSVFAMYMGVNGGGVSYQFMLSTPDRSKSFKVVTPYTTGYLGRDTSPHLIVLNIDTADASNFEWYFDGDMFPGSATIQDNDAITDIAWPEPESLHDYFAIGDSLQSISPDSYHGTYTNHRIYTFGVMNRWVTPIEAAYSIDAWRDAFVQGPTRPQTMRPSSRLGGGGLISCSPVLGGGRR